MVNIGDRVQYGVREDGTLRDGASLPARVGHHAIVAGVSFNCRIQFESDGLSHVAPPGWIRVVEQEGPW